MADAIRVEGAARLQRTLHRAATMVGDMDRADTASARYLAARARALAPRRTGTLAASITTSPSEGATVIAGAGYAAYVEHGVPSRYIPAQPYMAPALEIGEPVVVGLYATEIDRALAQVKGA